MRTTRTRKRKAKTRIPNSVPLLRSSARALLLLVILPQLFSAPAHSAASQKRLKANEPYALIFGTVWGPDDHPVFGVLVKIRRTQDKKAKWELSSDHHGEFAQRLPAGEADYVVWADLKGVKTADGKSLRLVQEVPVHVDNDERVDIGLHLAFAMP
jgi:hypothetical protein